MNRPSTKAELRSNKARREEFLDLERNSIYIVLDSLKCAHNIGTILRLADALLVKKVFVCGNTIIPPNAKIRAGSRGAEKWVPWEYRESAVDAIKELKATGTYILSAELTETSIGYDEIDYTFPLCIVLGREYDGVSNEILAISDGVVSLPIYGMTNSLNVSTTASVLLYEALKKLKDPVPKVSSGPPNLTASVGAS